MQRLVSVNIRALVLFVLGLLISAHSMAALDQLSDDIRNQISGTLNSYVHNLLEEKKGNLAIPVAGYVEIQSIQIEKSATLISRERSEISFEFRFLYPETIQIIDSDFEDSNYQCKSDWIGSLEEVSEDSLLISCEHENNEMAFFKLPKAISFAVSIDGRYRVSSIGHQQERIAHYLYGFRDMMAYEDFKTLESRSALPEIPQRAYDRSSWVSVSKPRQLISAALDGSSLPVSMLDLYHRLSSDPVEGRVLAVGECRISVSELRRSESSKTGEQRFYFGFSQAFDHNFNGLRRKRDLWIAGNIGPALEGDHSSYYQVTERGRIVLVRYFHQGHNTTLKILEFSSPGSNVLKAAMYISKPHYQQDQLNKYQIRSCGYSPEFIEDFYDELNQIDPLK